MNRYEDFLKGFPMLKVAKYFTSFLLAVVFSCITGCSSRIDINLDGPFESSEYVGGQPGDSRIVSADIREDISKWLLDKHTWRIDFVTYVPKHTIRADNFTLNCIGDIVVLNFKEQSSDRWMQYSCVIDKKMESILERIKRENQELVNDTEVILP